MKSKTRQIVVVSLLVIAVLGCGDSGPVRTSPPTPKGYPAIYVSSTGNGVLCSPSEPCSIYKTEYENFKTVYLLPGVYKLSRPLRIKGSYLDFIGDERATLDGGAQLKAPQVLATNEPLLPGDEAVYRYPKWAESRCKISSKMALFPGVEGLCSDLNEHRPGRLSSQGRSFVFQYERTTSKPGLEMLLDVQGTDISFFGVTFKGTSWDIGELGYVEVQAGVRLVGYREFTDEVIAPTSIAVKGDRVSFVGCEFKELGSLGVWLYGHGNGVFNSWFHDLDGGAIIAGEVHVTAPINTALTVVGNTIERTGRKFRGQAALLVGYSRDTLIQDNTIADAPYTGISMGWGWDHHIHPDSGNNKIIDNVVVDVMKVMADGGSVYTLGAQYGSLVKGNYLRGSGGHGIYPDESSRGFTFIDNYVINIEGYWLHMWTPTIYDNVVTNNYHDNDREMVQPNNIVENNPWIN